MVTHAAVLKCFPLAHACPRTSKPLPPDASLAVPGAASRRHPHDRMSKNNHCIGNAGIGLHRTKRCAGGTSARHYVVHVALCVVRHT
jgi:hypothetical protein